MRIKKFTMVLFGLLFLWTTAPAATFYVKQWGSGDANGTSWSNASGDLQAMIDAAANSTGEKIVLVAAGTYYPGRLTHNNGSVVSNTTRDFAFVLRPDVKIYGGFPSNISNGEGFEKRDLSNAKTILSGDLDGSYGISNGDAYHVVISTGNVGSALLDGFTITGGNASSTNISTLTLNTVLVDRRDGGGIYVRDSSPTLNNLLITGNVAHYSAGGIYTSNSAALITNTIINSNRAATEGGGISIRGGNSLALANVLISGNVSGKGGGVFCYDGNTAPVFINTTIAGNFAPSGGGFASGGNGNPAFYNTIVFGNNTNIHLDTGTNPGRYSAHYSLIQGQNDITNNCIPGGLMDPNSVFVQAVQATATIPTAAGDYRLLTSVYNPVIERGNNGEWSTVRFSGMNLLQKLGITSLASATDLAGQPRVYNFAGGGRIDMGAYEAQSNNDMHPKIFHVKQGATGSGASWSDASGDLQAMINSAYLRGDGVVYVAQGTYKPTSIVSNNGTVPSTSARDFAFVLRPDVKIYGGFSANPANGVGLAARGDWKTNTTILSGDLNNNGIDNNDAHHVVVSAGSIGGALLDGFTITGGNANGSNNLTVNSESIARNSGGGLYIRNSVPTFTNLIVTGNVASSTGGGIENVACSPTYSDMTVKNNRASEGAGVTARDNGSNPIFANVLISGNAASNRGGGVFSYGNARPMFVNVTIAGNHGQNSGGGIVCSDNNALATLYNTIVWGNNSGFGGSNATAYNSLIQGRNDVTNNCVSANGIRESYVFIELVKAANNAPVDGGDYRLSSALSCPAIDRGSNAYWTSTSSIAQLGGVSLLNKLGISSLDAAKDLAGNARVYNNTIEMGAYEYRGNDVVPEYFHAKEGATGNGSSWSDASGDLQKMIDLAQFHNKSVFVAAGTYKPTRIENNDGTVASTTSNHYAFILRSNVKIYGGFSKNAQNGDGMATRNWKENVTILSGDLNGNGLDNADAQHVVVSVGDVGSALLDGFTITAGNATGGTTTTRINGHDLPRRDGAGMYIRASSPTLNNLIVAGNSADYAGGGIYMNSSSSPVINNTIIRGNKAGAEGGGITISGASRPALAHVLITGNAAVSRGGGVFCLDNNTNPVLVNVTIAGNYASSGGGIESNSSSRAYLYNSIIWGNSTANNNASVTGTIPTAFHSLLQGRQETTNNCAPAGMLPDNAIFVGLAKAANNAPTVAGDYRLISLSNPAINGGSEAHWRTSLTELGNVSLLQKLGLTNSDFGTIRDLGGNSRTYNNSAVDMGVYEYQSNLILTRCYVRAGATGSGTSWDDASGDLQSMIDLASSRGDTVLVAAGVYKPTRLVGNDGTVASTAQRDRAFVLRPNVVIYGGFPAEGQVSDVIVGRNWMENATILSGDLDNSGGFSNDDALHVVVSVGAVGKALLDGFHITGGYTNEGTGSEGNFSRLNINGSYLYRRGDGGGIHNRNSSPRYNNLYIYNNRAKYSGGGIYNAATDNTESSPIVTNVIIKGNRADYEGGGFNSRSDGASGKGNPRVTNALITGNTSNNWAGGVFFIGDGFPVLTNVTVAGNYAKNEAGAIRCAARTNTSSAQVTLNNCILWGNSAGISKTSTTYMPIMNSCLVQGENSITNNCISASSITDEYSIFEQLAKVTGLELHSVTGDYSLKAGSPVIDRGSNAYLLLALDLLTSEDLLTTTDAEGHIRLGGERVDMGAREFGTPYYVVEEEKVDVTLDLTVFLHGPMQSTGGTMTNYIQTGGGSSYFDTPQLPTVDPYGLGTPCANISSVETVGSVVDWIKVEIWDAAGVAGESKVLLEGKALLLQTDGKVVDVDGNAPKFELQSDSVRIIVKHRNHLGVMSNTISSFKGMVEYDFSTSIDQAYKLDSDKDQMELKGGRYCLIPGDVFNDGYVDGDDLILFKSNTNNASDSIGVYINSDLNMDGYIDSDDNNAFLPGYSNSYNSVLYNFE